MGDQVPFLPISTHRLALAGIIHNLVPVTLGNIISGVGPGRRRLLVHLSGGRWARLAVINHLGPPTRGAKLELGPARSRRCWALKNRADSIDRLRVVQMREIQHGYG
jgi:hypothetical protein